MADLASYGNSDRDRDRDRDIEQALIALKRGTQLIKYSRTGKPKFRSFRLSPDETTLIWYSKGSEKILKLSAVRRILPGQRTPVFRRYLRPDKEYLSFSLVYNNGERSLDLICKDQSEADLWIAGLRALTSTGQDRSSRQSRSDFSDFVGVECNRHSGLALEATTSLAKGRLSVDSNSPFSDVGFISANMQGRTSVGDGFRISVSSSPSCSSGGSGQDDIESLGDVYVWGETWSDGPSNDKHGNPIPVKSDALTPKGLESNVVLDVHQISCGFRHVALVTKQSEVFTWGEESGGRLGHGVEKDYSRPRLVEFLAVTNVDFVACGHYHTCAVSTSGDLYTWGDGTHNAGLLGQGNDVSHWIPKRVSGPLEGLQVLSVACGTWHSAVATSNGKLFTFGDGAFGVLGHGDRESVLYPKEVQLLSGLKTIKVACGVWHTAAIIEVTNQSGSAVPSRKLFTWGDGDKYRLGHGNKETYLLPTCVSALIDYNFFQIACGHNTIVALTTSGHVFTTGSNTFGQLGNPQSEGKLPCLVQDRLVGEFVEEIACGAFHIAVLTSRNEVYTWGKGANGRLGHGDCEDRKIPTMIEALKDRHVRSIVCGSNYTASICIHKWVSGADQSVCSGCRQPFGFTRKRHNCYNCGLVHCHSCSSKKALKAALAPTPGKPHRVCDSCYIKLKKAAEAANVPNFSRKGTMAYHHIDGSNRLDRGETRRSRVLLNPTTEPVKYLEVKSVNPGNRADSSYSIVRASQAPSLLQLKDITFPSSLSALQYALKPVITSTSTSTSQASSNSRPASPYSQRPSPPRSATPPFSRGVIDSLKKTNELLNQEVNKLQNQMKGLKQLSEIQDEEVQKLRKKVEEGSSLAEERYSMYNMVVKAMKSITTQLKEVMETIPPEISERERFVSINAEVESILENIGSKEHNAPPYQTSSSAGEGAKNVNSYVPKQSVLGTEKTLQPSASVSSKASKEVIEQFEPGVYVTLLQLSDGSKIFKRVKFSKRRFVEQQAAEWWKHNKDRLLNKYSPTKINSNASTGPPLPSSNELSVEPSTEPLLSSTEPLVEPSTEPPPPSIEPPPPSIEPSTEPPGYSPSAPEEEQQAA